MGIAKNIEQSSSLTGFEDCWILSTIGELLAAGEQQIGGKAMGLAKLEATGARVPPWFSITADAFSLQLTGSGLLEQAQAVFRGQSEIVDLDETRIAKIRGRIKSLTLNADFLSRLDDALQVIGPGPFAVRSSMIGEDSASFSFAGQLETFLYQRSLEDVAGALCACWASCLSDRVMAYRKRSGMNASMPRMAVVVQQMISGQVSGVAFSSHPVSGVRDHVLITAAWGLGEGVVGGHCNTDDYTCSHSGDEVEVSLADKDLALVEPGDDSTGTVELEVSADKRKIRCLSTDQVAELSAEVCRHAAEMAKQFTCSRPAR